MKTISLSDDARQAITLALYSRIEACAKDVAATRTLDTAEGMESHAYWLGEGQKARAAFVEFSAACRA